MLWRNAKNLVNFNKNSRRTALEPGGIVLYGGGGRRTALERGGIVLYGGGGRRTAREPGQDTSGNYRFPSRKKQRFTSTP
jgi:hypothetical protein